MHQSHQVYGYIRVSTVRQGQSGSSLQEQRDAIVRYAERHNLTISAWFEERETAAKRGRRQFSRMLSFLKRGRAAGVIIHKIDRSARNLKDWADLGELIDAGINVHFAHESLDLHSRGGRLAADIQAVVASDYIRNLRDEVRKGFYGRLKQGLYPMRAPLGYLDMGKGNAKEPDPVAVPFVRKAFELYATGRYNLHTLKDELHRLGLRNRQGGRVSLTGMSTVLNNPFYFGVIRIKRTGETFKGLHEPIISKTLFDRVQAVLRGRLNGRPNRHQFLFSRLFRCGVCGYSLIGEKQKGHVYYRCHTRGCPTTAIREETADTTVKTSLAPIKFSERLWQAVSLELAVQSQNWSVERDARIKSLQLQLKALSSRNQRLTDAFLDAMIDKASYQERRMALLSEIAAIEQNIGNLRKNTSRNYETVADFLERAKMAQQLYESGSDAEKRELVESTTSNRLLKGKKLGIELQIPFSAIEKYTKSYHGAPHRDDPRTLRTAAKHLIETLFKYFSDNSDQSQR